MKTKNKFESLKFEVGDIFTERFSYFIHVVRIIDGRVVTLEGPDRGGDKSIIKEYKTHSEFIEYCSYNHTTGYWVDYIGNYGEAVYNLVEKYKRSMKWPASLTNKDIYKKRIRRRELEKILYDI